MSQKSIHIDGVGKILFEHSRRAKHINLSVKPFRGVRVAVPPRVSLRQAEAVARTKIPWLKKHVIKMATIEKMNLDFNRRNDLSPALARDILVERVKTLADTYGFAYARVFIRNQKTRWGSCSLKNNINLNIRTAQLPLRLMDYVILHELVHTRIRNHSALFWKEMEKFVVHPKQTDRELNRYGFLLAG